MAVTIIDSLMVTLGLDPNPFKKAALEAERQQKSLKESSKKSSNEITDAFMSVGRSAATMLLGFEGIKGAISYFSNLNVANANLGRFSANLGQSAHEVNTWDSAVELMGGSAKESEADLMGLSSSLTALRATGDVSPMVLLLQRMGVAVYDAQGKTRKLTDIFKDLGDKLRTYNRADAFNLARQAGISESTFNLIRAEADERDRILATAEANNAVTEENVKQAAELQSQWREIGQGIKGAATELLATFTPYLMTAFHWIQQIFTGVKNTGFLRDVFKGIGGALKVIVDLARLAWSGLSQLFALFADSKVGKWLAKLLPKLKEFGSSFVDEADELADKYASEKKATNAGDKRTLGLRNNNPGNLRFAGQAGAEEGEGGFARFPTLAAGIQAANRQLDLYAKRGINTIGAIVSKWAPKNENDTGAYIGRLEKQLGVGRNQPLTAADRQKLLGAIFNQGEGNKVGSNLIATALNANPTALQAARFADTATANGGASVARNGGGATTINIDNIAVHAPQARDADGIAAEFPGALKRKGIVAQADSGQS
jgi:hypothetical protein